MVSAFVDYDAELEERICGDLTDGPRAEHLKWVHGLRESIKENLPVPSSDPEAAQVILGDSSKAVTEAYYAEPNVKAAIEVARRIG